MELKRGMMLRPAGTMIMDIIEKYLPALIFASMFIAFMLQVISRYFFTPLTWPLEFNLMCYIWIIIFGALQAQREDEHTRFSLIYDAVKPGVQRIFRIIGSVLIISSFTIALYPSYRYISFMSFKKANTLPIRMDFAFYPFMIFLLVMIGRYARQLYVDIRGLVRKEDVE